MIKRLSVTNNSQSGMVLPLALILLVIASIIIVPGLLAMQNFMTINSNIEQDTMAYYAADAGIADCIWKYRYGTPPTIKYTLTNINGMNVDVIPLAQSAAQNYFWQASAPSGSASKAQVVILINVPLATQGVFNLAVASLGGDIAMSGSTLISSDNPAIDKGSAYANGSITRNKGSENIIGNASATGTVDANITVGGTRTNSAPPVTFALAESIATYTQQAQTQGQTVASFIKSSGNWNLGGAGNPSYITGNLQLTGTATINVVGPIYIGGTFTMGNGTNMRGGNAVICNGTIALGGDSSAQLPLNQNPLVVSLSSATPAVSVTNGTPLSAIIYAPNGNVAVSGAGKVYGSIYAKSVTLSASGQLYYETGLKGTTGLPTWMPAPGGNVTVRGYDYR